ncbi:MAG: bifunctional 4-hydroxy-2-oxoglutarate aldolase/2-dehydro-3-deoxy-phosphogluconate aldolase [Planctomycetota bacterium]
MSEFQDRASVLAAFRAERCSAILRTPLADAVWPALEAAIEGGFRIVEVTMNTPGALGHIERLARSDGIVAGAGTVLSLSDAKAAMKAGARFLVSPVTDPQILAFCRQHDLVAVPGAYTPTEMMAAHRAGADFVKLFPAPADGPTYLRACRGPLPFLDIYPTSGVTEQNVEEWFRAGAFGVGFVGSLFDPADLASGRFDLVRERASRMIGRVRAAIAAGSAPGG